MFRGVLPIGPRFRKKRRGVAGPNKNQKKVLSNLRAARPTSEGETLAGKFPAVESLTLRLDFTTPQRQALDGETKAFGPSDACDFTAPCPGRCGGYGVFDFTPAFTSAIARREASAEAHGTCQQPIFAGSPEGCGMQLACRIAVVYRPE